MKFTYPIIEATFIKREKRFFAYCQLLDSSEVVAHCPNPGSMKGNLISGSKVWLLDFGPEHLLQKKKLRYKWILVESEGVNVVIDTLCANQIVYEALMEGKIEGISSVNVQREKKIGDSRIDLYIPGKPETFIEVKSVSMGIKGAGAFPDSVTTRGQKHINDLVQLKEKGKRAILLFLLMREKGTTVQIAGEIDPQYKKLLSNAIQNGLEVLVYTIKLNKSGICLSDKGVFLA